MDIASLTMLQALAREVAVEHRVNPDLLLAICEVESGWNPGAMRFEPNWTRYVDPEAFASRNEITAQTERTMQSMSLGLCQVMGAVARELGHDGYLSDLFLSKWSLKYGAMKLRQLIDRYGDAAESDVIAAYNAGSARKALTGMYVNQRYVDKVHAVLLRLRRV